MSDLLKQLAEKREALKVFRFGSTGAKITNVKTGRGLRRDIARILTNLRQGKK
ncbi:MAG: 50S ribosomal protein L29 [Candidatus Vogelbacteria bacterium]|nr:50S ribosomal protein L29 [Candidatus Vogelbacteria bacterium]